MRRIPGGWLLLAGLIVGGATSPLTAGGVGFNGGSLRPLTRVAPPPPVAPPAGDPTVDARLKAINDRLDALLKEVAGLKPLAVQVDAIKKDLETVRIDLDALYKRVERGEEDAKGLNKKLADLQTRVGKAEADKGKEPERKAEREPTDRRRRDRDNARAGVPAPVGVWWPVCGWQWTCCGCVPATWWVFIPYDNQGTGDPSGDEGSDMVRFQGTGVRGQGSAEVRSRPRVRVASAGEEFVSVSRGVKPAAGGSARERMDVADLQPEDAERLFWTGNRLYWQGKYAEAWRSLDGAVRLSAEDARYWYFKALTERALGDVDAAEKSRRKGVELQRMASPRAEVVGRALERVQGPSRMWLREGSPAR